LKRDVLPVFFVVASLVVKKVYTVHKIGKSSASNDAMTGGNIIPGASFDIYYYFGHIIQFLTNQPDFIK